MKDRSPNRVQNPYTLTHIYKYYDEKITNPESKYKVDYKTYRMICEEFNRLVVTDILENAASFKMPLRLGEFRIKLRKTKYDKLRYDYGHYNKTGEKAVHLNEHSRDYYAKWHWHKKKCFVSNISTYSFILSRHNKRWLAKLMKDNGRQIKYFE